VRIGAVIVAFESDAVLPAALEALSVAAARTPSTVEVVVVDNGSSRKLQLPIGEGSAARVVRLESNLGFSPAVNVAAQELTAVDYLLLLNPDARVHPDAIRLLLGAFDDPRVAIAGPLFVDSSGRVLQSERPFYSVRSELVRQFAPFATRRSIASRRALRGGAARRLSGACMLVERRFLAACGGLDESIRMYLEDAELCRRAYDLGRSVRLVPAARCTHVPGQSSGGRNETTDLGLYLTLLASRVEFVRRRRGRSAACAMRAVIAAGAVVRLITQPRLPNRRKQLAVVRWAASDGSARWDDGPVTL
jgi:N-acetylglucosaminyl-diphospho-decaprenol L-rhamnosyltransferase